MPEERLRIGRFEVRSMEEPILPVVNVNPLAHFNSSQLIQELMRRFDSNYQTITMLIEENRYLKKKIECKDFGFSK